MIILNSFIYLFIYLFHLFIYIFIYLFIYLLTLFNVETKVVISTNIYRQKRNE